jgi:hypothetical protein
MIAENTERKAATFKQYGVTDDGKSDTWMKLKLYDAQGGISPYTGATLPKPGSPEYANELEIEHIYPGELGGLTVTENLVVTFKTENAQKGKRTPREYAALLGIPFATMLAHTEKMRWGKHGRDESGKWLSLKREVFQWEDSKKIPEFGNTTRIAQLAKQLQSALAQWLGCRTDDERQARIGSPTGFQTSVCRRAWGLPDKDRADLTHHLVDAIILSHIPPREGQNYAASGGIFYPHWDAKHRREYLRALPLGPDLQRVQELARHDGDACPILKHRSSSRHRSMHDKTHFRVLADGTLAYRAPFPPKDEIEDSASLRAMLVAMGIPSTYRNRKGEELPLIPSESALNRWLDSSDAEPLRLMNGTPVRAIWKTSGKGSVAEDPSGFHARWVGEDDTLCGVKSVLGRWAALELWRAWNQKRKRWDYYKKLVPAPGVRKALRSLGYSWEKKSKRKWREGAPELTAPLKKLLGGELPPYARPAVFPGTTEPVVFRLGSTFRAGISADGKLAKRGTPPARFEWLEVASVMAEGHGRLRLVSLAAANAKKHEPMSPDDLANLAGLPTADDSSSYPTHNGVQPPEKIATSFPVAVLAGGWWRRFCYGGRSAHQSMACV